ncbi:MAG: DNA polymerase III subunit delta [Verrucomicrobiaceae bacterium]
MPVYVVTGSDEGKVSEEASKLFEKLKPAGSDEFANEIIEGAADNAEHAHTIASQAVEGLQTMGFFGGAKVVWLKNANFMASDRTSEAERAKTGVENILDTLRSGLPDEVTFLLSATGIDKRRAFYKWLTKNAEVRSYDRIDVSKDGWEDKVALLVERGAGDKNLTFTSDALHLFVQLAGEDTRQISNELEKLSLFLGTDRSEVTLADVQTMVPLSRKGVIWEISRAIEARRASRAIELIDQQLTKNESAIALVKAAIIPTVRNLFFAKLIEPYRSVNSAPKGILAVLPKKKEGGINTWGLKMAAKGARGFTLPQLQRGLEACLHADRALVTTGQDHRMVLHRLVVELCTK